MPSPALPRHLIVLLDCDIIGTSSLTVKLIKIVHPLCGSWGCFQLESYSPSHINCCYKTQLKTRIDAETDIDVKSHLNAERDLHKREAERAYQELKEDSTKGSGRQQPKCNQFRLAATPLWEQVLFSTKGKCGLCPRNTWLYLWQRNNVHVGWIHCIKWFSRDCFEYMKTITVTLYLKAKRAQAGLVKKTSIHTWLCVVTVVFWLVLFRISNESIIRSLP